MTRPYFRWMGITLTSAFALGHAAPALAQTNPADAASAQALYDQGKRLMNDGKFEEACPKLEVSQRLDPATGTQFHLADCWEHVGRTASAWATFLDVAAEAKNSGRADREQLARARAAALEPRLSRLTLSVAGTPPPGLELRRDGALVPQAMWGAPVPVDLGVHKLVASAPGRKTWEKQLNVATEGANVAETVPELPVGESQPAQPTSPQPLAARPASHSAQRTIGLVTAGAGVVSLGIAGVLGLSAKSKFSDAKSQCAQGCDDKGAATNRDALSEGNLATIFFGFGLGLAAVGGGLWLTAPKEHEESPAQAALVELPTIRLGPHLATVSVGGNWQ
ncbi:MAG TPA: hypothetical protein VGI10_14000 [Polyangiaceae bacterium]|jgi:hypothetical protein